MLSFYLSLLDTEDEKIKFEHIYNQYKEPLAKYALSILKNEEMANDATANAFIAIAKNIESFPDKSNPKYRNAYAYLVLKNAAIDLYRSNQRHQDVLFSENMDNISIEETPYDILAENEAISDLVKCIEGMSDTYRDVLKLKYLYELSNAQISELLGISLNSVKVKCTRGIEKLRANLKQRGIK